MHAASSKSQPLSIEYRPIAELKPYKNNARTHSRRQKRQILESIRRFGFINPVIIDSSGRIIAGHGRVEAAKELGLDVVPTVMIEHLTEDQIRAYILADNRIAELAGWDRQILAIELQHLLKIEDPDFDITITAFEVSEVDQIIAEAEGHTDMEDPVPEPNPDLPAITEPGDVWSLGKSRLICGNSLHEETYRALMGKTRAAAVMTDPPFSVRIHGHATGNGAIRHREFAMASGEMSEAEFLVFLNNSLRLLAKYCMNNSLAYLFIDWRHVADLIAAGHQNYNEFINLCVWKKDRGGLGSMYRFQHELVLVFRKGNTHRNNIQLGKFGRNRTNIWEYPSINTLSKQSDEGNLLALHPTVKPVAMIADALLDSTARGEIVLDAFLGSGTTLMVAERVGRICYGIEIDPLYVDVAIRRWQNYTGEAAIHEVTGKRFDEIARSKEVAHA